MNDSKPGRPRWVGNVEMLTPSEIQSLRQEAKETSAFARKAFAHLRPPAIESTNVMKANPTCPSPHVRAALRRWAPTEPVEPRHRSLSASGMERIARRLARRTAAEVASFPRGDHAPPIHVLRALRHLSWLREREQ
jgi:hypothetical protein